MHSDLPQNQKGFTLIEMIVVVIVIGIMAAAIIPRL
nr:prepilin-type N-terminal cleavage/methylation domain-containing protein [Planctomycetota bacterium]